jgi:hypothetical protein
MLRPVIMVAFALVVTWFLNTPSVSFAKGAPTVHTSRPMTCSEKCVERFGAGTGRYKRCVSRNCTRRR